MVCPGFPWKARDLRTELVEKNTATVLNNNVSKHFPAVGIRIRYWVVKQGKHAQPFIVDGNVWSDIHDTNDPTLSVIENSILRKMSNRDMFLCKEDGDYSSGLLRLNTVYTSAPTEKNIYPIRHASKVKVCYVPSPTACHYKRKVMMTYSGYPDFQYYDENTPMSSCKEMSGYIEVKNKKEGQNLIRLYESKLYRFRRSIGRSGGMHGWKDYTLPKVDLSRSWSDQELYEHFGLTQEEISYIEATINLQ